MKDDSYLLVSDQRKSDQKNEKPVSLIFAAHRRNSDHKNMKLRKMSYTELTLLLSGNMEYGNGKENFSLAPGDVLFLKCGSMRRRSKGNSFCDYVSFNFNLGRDFDFPPVIRGGVTPQIRTFLAALDSVLSLEHRNNSSEMIENLILMILLSLEDELRQTRVHPLVETIRQYLHQHLSEKITLADVAEHCFFSPVYCDSVFKAETGSSIIDYLIDQRVEQAKLLLIQGLYSIRQIGQMTGFQDANYFSRQFKKRTGYTPSEYRRAF
ncbi:MAG: helix-turn-helix transcriptional regulator [Clostridia bacterium]|nr:helix-turn-helix transcriptional regulator [Clostridia bacterium]